jgi:hypothetical protein
MFWVRGQPNGPLQKNIYQNMHPQLINMDLQEGMVIKVYNKKIVK